MYLTPDLVANVLVRQRLLTADQARELLAQARKMPRHLRSPKAYERRSVAYELIIQQGFRSPSNGGKPIDEHTIADAIASDSGLERVRIDTLRLDADLIESQISRPFARRHRMIPMAIVGGAIKVACANPYDLESIDSFKQLAGREVQLVVASEPEILKALTEFYGLRQSVRALRISGSEATTNCTSRPASCLNESIDSRS